MSAPSSPIHVPRDIVVERSAIDGQIAKQAVEASSVAALKTIFSTEGPMGFTKVRAPARLGPLQRHLRVGLRTVQAV